MALKEELESDLCRITSAIVQVNGVVAVILFGSRARGDYDEYSDYDLLVLFEDEEVMWENRKKLYENIGKLSLFTQVLTRSMKELYEKTEPTFLQNILEHGIILYLRYPMKAQAFLQNLRPMTIVTYDLRELAQNEKVKTIYRLFGKRKTKGVVQQNGGRKLGDTCFIIPTESLEEALEILRLRSVEFKISKVYQPQ